MTASGLLVVNKPSGPTSHDVVAAFRRLLGTRAVGHAGTLDPLASGVLVLLVGEATKLSPYLALDEKTYRARVRFGTGTTTLDAAGDVTETAVVPAGALAAGLPAALAAERVRTEQIPPAFSAISIGGKRAHRLARKGETVLLPPRPVAVRSAVLLEHDETTACFDLEVSKGYYVRSFARDLGLALGLPSHLASLERRSSGPYQLSEAIPFPPAEAPPLLPLVDAACRALPTAHLLAEGLVRAVQGKRLAESDFRLPPPPAVSAWLTPDGKLAAVGEPDPEGGFRVRRGFRDEL